MNKHPRISSVGISALALTLAACGGGGGSSTTTPTGGTAPSAGNYAWLLKAQGPTSSLSYGLSLLHPSTPGTEYVIESGSAVVTDAKAVLSGSVSATGLAASALQTYALLYIVGGDVRRIPLVANGSSPSTQVQRAQSTTACTFLLEAIDYATPENSRFIVSTAGPDGQCGTADDGAAEVALGGTNGLSFTPITGAAPLAYFRQTTSLAPAGWIYPTNVTYWQPALTVSTRSGSQAAFSAAVLSAYNSALVSDGTQLSVIDVSGSTPVVTALGTALTPGTGWAGIGYDASNYYVYQNSSTGSSWTVLSISRTAPVASVLKQGAGQIALASMGTTVLYATVVGASTNSLVSISKTPGAALTTLNSTALTTLTTVQTSASGVHELWRIDNIGTAQPSYGVQMIDESGNTLYTSAAGGFPMAVADASTLGFGTSESRSRFLFATGYGALSYSGATLMGYDASTRSATTIGAFAGAAAYGTNFVFASAQGGPASFMAAYSAASVNGSVQQSGSQVMVFDITSPASLTLTTKTAQ